MPLPLVPLALPLLLAGAGCEPPVATATQHAQEERVFEVRLAGSLAELAAGASRSGGVEPTFEHAAASVRAALDWIESAGRQRSPRLRFALGGRTDVEEVADDGVNVVRFVPGASGAGHHRYGHALRVDVHSRDGAVRGFDVTLFGGGVRWHVASTAGWMDQMDVTRRLTHDLGFALGLRHRDVWMNGLACLEREPLCRKEWTRKEFDVDDTGRPMWEGGRVVPPEHVGELLAGGPDQGGAVAFRVRARGAGALRLELWDARSLAGPWWSAEIGLEGEEYARWLLLFELEPVAALKLARWEPNGGVEWLAMDRLPPDRAPRALGDFAHRHGGRSGGFPHLDGGPPRASVLWMRDWGGAWSSWDLLMRRTVLHDVVGGRGEKLAEEALDLRWMLYPEPVWFLVARPVLAEPAEER